MRVHTRSISSVGVMLALAAAPLAAQVRDIFGKPPPVRSAATVTIAAGPHAGIHALDGDLPCTIGPLDAGDPDRFAATLATENMRLSKLADKPNELSMIDVSIPNVAPNRLADLTFSVVFGDPAIRARKGRIPGISYGIDTRPDSALKPFQREMRGSNQLRGRGGSTLHRQGSLRP